VWDGSLLRLRPPWLLVFARAEIENRWEKRAAKLAAPGRPVWNGSAAPGPRAWQAERSTAWRSRISRLTTRDRHCASTWVHGVNACRVHIP